MILAEELNMFNGQNPFYCIGFKSLAPEFSLLTWIWASVKVQMLVENACREERQGRKEIGGWRGGGRRGRSNAAGWE